ncbi:MAG: hypothetical protein WBO75_10165, partial [Trichococcus flocculiformis]
GNKIIASQLNHNVSCMKICEKPYYYGVISSSFDLKRIYLKTANNIHTRLFFIYYPVGRSWIVNERMQLAIKEANPKGGTSRSVMMWVWGRRSCLSGI